jgi:predicted peptidase
MKKLLFFLLIIPTLINAQLDRSSLTLESRDSHLYVQPPSESTLLKVYGITFNQAIGWEKTTIGNVPAMIYRPSGLDATKKYSVWLYLHGDGQVVEKEPDLNKILNSGDQSQLLLAAERYGFIVVAPQLVLNRNGYYPGWKDEYLKPVYDYILGNANTDIARIVVTGLSRGGGGTWIAITGSFAPYVSAAIPICGTPQYTQDYSIVANNNIPVWAFHAKDDQTVGYVHTVNTIALINKFSPAPAPLYTEYSTGGHPIWGRVYSDSAVYNWALSKSNSSPVVTPPAPVPVDEIIGTYRMTIYKSGAVKIEKQ